MRSLIVLCLLLASACAKPEGDVSCSADAKVAPKWLVLEIGLPTAQNNLTSLRTCGGCQYADISGTNYDDGTYTNCR